VIRFTVPGNPVAKGRARISVRGGQARAYTPAKTVAYEGLIAHEGQHAMDGRVPLEGAVALSAVATFAIPKSWSKKARAAAIEGCVWHTSRPDGDNIIKAIGDGLNGIAWRDDSQVASTTIIKRYGLIPGVEVEVIEL
jgi:Holliday junction resolvase RusA-like endonuclease